MKDVTEQYNFTTKESDLTRYSDWFNGAKTGSPNGLSDIENMELRVSRIGAALQKESGVRPVNGGAYGVTHLKAPCQMKNFTCGLNPPSPESRQMPVDIGTMFSRQSRFFQRANQQLHIVTAKKPVSTAEEKYCIGTHHFGDTNS
ncbi:MAG: hypothetical protein AABZ10_02125 [Nitrospirota bacterium]